MKEVSHPNGLKVRLAESLSVEQLANGFRIAPHGSKERRYPVEVLLSFHAGLERPEGEWPEERQIGSRIIKYRESRTEAGGASGDQIISTVEAWEAHPSGYILYVHTYPEGEPDVTLGWRIIENTVLSK